MLIVCNLQIPYHLYLSRFVFVLDGLDSTVSGAAPIIEMAGYCTVWIPPNWLQVVTCLRYIASLRPLPKMYSAELNIQRLQQQRDDATTFHTFRLATFLATANDCNGERLCRGSLNKAGEQRETMAVVQTGPSITSATCFPKASRDVAIHLGLIYEF
jgi:hypothetical protein